VPGIVSSLIAPKAADARANDDAVLLKDDTVGIGIDVDGPTDGTGIDRILVAIEAYRQVFDTVAVFAWKPSNGPR